MQTNKRHIAQIIIYFLAGAAFAAPRFFDGEKIREIQIIQPQNAENDLRAAQFFYNTYYYNLCFSNTNLDTIKTASSKYASDFQKKKLSRKNKKSLKKYGAFSVHCLEWGTTRQNIDAFSENVRAYCGYSFVQKSPYFVISIQNAQNQSSNQESSPALASSGKIVLFFTKTQIIELINEMEK